MDFTQIKKLMGYKGKDVVCKMCTYFVPDDCSGEWNAKHRHCKYNPSFDMPVDETGCCKHFNAKGEKI